MSSLIQHTQCPKREIWNLKHELADRKMIISATNHNGSLHAITTNPGYLQQWWESRVWAHHKWHAAYLTWHWPKNRRPHLRHLQLQPNGTPDTNYDTIRNKIHCRCQARVILPPTLRPRWPSVADNLSLGSNPHPQATLTLTTHSIWSIQSLHYRASFKIKLYHCKSSREFLLHIQRVPY